MNAAQREIPSTAADESDAVFHRGLRLAALSSMGMPPLNGFIGEITILAASPGVSQLGVLVVVGIGWAQRTNCCSSGPCSVS